MLQAVSHVITIPAVVYAIMTEQYAYLWLSFIVFLIIGLNVSITMHRYLTHKSFKTYAWLEKLLICISPISTVGPTINWVASHRQHHARSDVEGDPHSPHVDGKFSFKQAMTVWLGLDWRVPNIPVKYAKDLMRS